MRKYGTCLAVFLGVMAVLGVPLFLGVRYIARWGADFNSLANTTEAINCFIADRHQWPQNWESLAPYFARVDPPRDEDDISAAQKRIEVNFQIDFQKAPQPLDWYVHVRSQTNHGQEGEQNYWLSRRIAELRAAP